MHLRKTLVAGVVVVIIIIIIIIIIITIIITLFLGLVHFGVVHLGGPWTGGQCFVHHRSHGNSVFSSPHPLDFHVLAIFIFKNITQGHEFELTYLYACWMVHM